MDHTFASLNAYIYLYNTWHTAPLLLGNVVATRDYDYGQGAPGALLRTTTNTYAWQSPNPNYSTYLTDNFLDLAASVQVKDGGGTQQAYTTYGYDEYSTYPLQLSLIHIWIMLRIARKCIRWDGQNMRWETDANSAFECLAGERLPPHRGR